MFTVALIGADGSGKTTVGRALASMMPDVTYIYMGVNPAASNIMLPTTRLWFWLKGRTSKATHQSGPPELERRRRGLIGELKSLLRLLLVVPEEIYRSRVVAKRVRSGSVVLLDRDYFVDFYAHDIAPLDPSRRSYAQRLHGYYLKRFYRRPDLLILLDAPATVLQARKGEGSLEELDRRRMEYYRLRSEVQHFEVVDVAQPLPLVVDQISKLLRAEREVKMDTKLFAGRTTGK